VPRAAEEEDSFRTGQTAAPPRAAADIEFSQTRTNPHSVQPRKTEGVRSALDLCELFNQGLQSVRGPGNPDLPEPVEGAGRMRGAGRHHRRPVNRGAATPRWCILPYQLQSLPQDGSGEVSLPELEAQHHGLWILTIHRVSRNCPAPTMPVLQMRNPFGHEPRTHPAVRSSHP
jgi:hypothetical protein